ncbi:hypothetical protein HDV02_001451, partial [Globomyces sp. JEL0801]
LVSEGVISDVLENNDVYDSLASDTIPIQNESNSIADSTDEEDLGNLLFDDVEQNEYYHQNLAAFEVYDLHAYYPPDLSSIVQIHILHCYNIVNEVVEKNINQFYFVVLMNVEYRNVKQPVGVCRSVLLQSHTASHIKTVAHKQNVAANGFIKPVSDGGLPPLTSLEYTVDDIQTDYSQTPTQDFAIHSQLSYPYDIYQDQFLANVLTYRIRLGVERWLKERLSTGLPHFSPEKEMCCGKSCVLTSRSDCHLYALTNFLRNVPVAHSKCAECGNTYHYDGRKDGLINYGDKHLFAVELLKEIMEFKYTNGTPVHAYWMAKTEMVLLDQEPSTNIRGRKYLKQFSGSVSRVLTAFLKLIRYPSDYFQCCKTPRVVCVDGIVLSIETRRLLAQSLTEPWRQTCNPLKKRFSTRKERHLLPNMTKTIRKLIKDLTLADTGVTQSDLISIDTHFNNPVSKFILMFKKERRVGDGFYVMPLNLAKLFKFMYKDVCPTSSLAPPSIYLHLNRILENRCINGPDVDEIGKFAPILVDLILFGSNILGISHYDIRSTTEDPTFGQFDCFLKLVEFIYKKSKHCFEIPNPGYISPISVVPEADRVKYGSDVEELSKTGSFFPGRPYHCKVADLLLKQSNTETLCCKQAKSPGNLGAGVLLFWCGDHRKCLGFVVLQSAEAPQHSNARSINL